MNNTPFTRQEYIEAILDHKDGNEKYELFLESLTLKELQSIAEKEFGDANTLSSNE